MEITVRCSQDLARVTGRTRFPVRLEEGATVGDLLAVLCADYPPLTALLAAAIPVVGGQHSGSDTPIRPGQEVALLTPVSGG